MAEEDVDQDFTELQGVEDKIRALTDELEEKMVELDKEYSKKKRPLFDERIKICSKIPNFWLNTLLNHSELQEYINTSDYDCLRHLKILDVQDVDQDGMQGTRYSFTFTKNPFFDNQVIFKEFKYNKESGELVVDTSPINWKDGCNLTLKAAQSSKEEKGKGKREATEDNDIQSFFCWFDSREETESPIGDWIREDIWKDPFKYFCGDDDEDGEEEDEDEDGEDGDDGEEGGEGEEEEEDAGEGDE